MSTMHEFDPNYPRPTDTPKFTPGPWKRQTRTGANRWRTVDARGHQVADINHYNEQAEHNADLIAAAPELYQSLLEMVEDSDDVDDKKLPKIPAATLTRARQALAKAVQS